MSTAQSVDTRLAEGLINHLRKAREALDVALKTWQFAVVEANTGRDRAEAARKAAWAAQLHGDDDEERLTRRAVEACAKADRADTATRQARRALVNAVSDAECAALRARSLTAGMPAADAARVERAVVVTTEHARAARDEARLGPSPEDAERQRCAEREAGERAAAAAAAAQAPKPVWERLVVTDDDERAVFDGHEYRLPRAAGAKMLRLLLAERGGLVAAKVIERNIGARPSRELDRLPGPIAELVEAPGRDRRGYRLLAALATEGRPRP